MDIITLAEVSGNLARQPEISGQRRTAMFIGLALIEVLALLGFVALFIA